MSKRAVFHFLYLSQLEDKVYLRMYFTCYFFQVHHFIQSRRVKLNGTMVGLQKSLYQISELVNIFILKLIKSHSKVKCNIQQCRCATDNDAGVKRAWTKIRKINKKISSNKRETSSHQSNYGSNQRFLR